MKDALIDKHKRTIDLYLASLKSDSDKLTRFYDACSIAEYALFRQGALQKEVESDKKLIESLNTDLGIMNDNLLKAIEERDRLKAGLIELKEYAIEWGYTSVKMLIIKLLRK